MVGIRSRPAHAWPPGGTAYTRSPSQCQFHEALALALALAAGRWPLAAGRWPLPAPWALGHASKWHPVLALRVLKARSPSFGGGIAGGPGLPAAGSANSADQLKSKMGKGETGRVGFAALFIVRCRARYCEYRWLYSVRGSSQRRYSASEHSKSEFEYG
jgi:hypothetical protein